MSIYEDKKFDGLFGRRTIYTSDDKVTKENVVALVNDALKYHIQNLFEEDYLYWYRRGVQPVLGRHKEVRPEICNKVVENHATEIVDFKNGYFLTQPAYYISRDAEMQDKVDELNEYLYRSGKHDVDNEIVDWFHTVGKAVLIIEPNDDKENPVSVYALDPRQAFVVYSMRPGNKPIMGVNMIVSGDKVKFDVFTENAVYRLSGSSSGKLFADTQVFTATAMTVDGVESNVLRKIPIIEYQYNSVNMGAFESVLPLLDAINDIQSNRADGISQFIQSLAVAVNCQFDEGTTANDIRQAGMIVLRSIGENKADFKILSEQLDQSQTQVLVDYIYQQVLTICCMPSTTKGGTSTSDTGTAVKLRDGFMQAETSARNEEDLFKRSNRLFDEIFIDILKRKNILDISINDFELHFVRNEEVNIQSKAQSLQTLLAAGIEPTIALAKSGVSNDPVSDYIASEKYMKMVWGDPDAQDMAVPGADMGADVATDESVADQNGSSVGSDPANGGGSANQLAKQAKVNFKDRMVAQLDKETGKQIKVFASLQDASKATGVNYRTISDVCNGKSSYGGDWKWKYVSGKNLNNSVTG